MIQDLGYYPFGSRFFTNLLHYVKTGDFVETHDSRCAGRQRVHVRDRRAVPLRLRQRRPRAGRQPGRAADLPEAAKEVRRAAVPYDKAPKQHIIVEFAFDVLLVAHGGYKLQAYHDFIGFKVATPLLERAFQATYGLEMDDLFLSQDLAIGTFRHAVGSTIPDMTKIAWERKQEQIQKNTPGALRDRFVLTLPRTEYEKEYGTEYQKPGAFARVLGFLYKLLPKIGPFRPLGVQGPDA